MSPSLSSVRVALAAVFAARLRSSLTALGISIGIAAVVVVVALGRGAREQVGGRIESLGSNVIYIFSRPVAKSGAKALVGSQGVTLDDAAAIRHEASAVSAVTVYSSTRRQVVTPYANAKTSIVGTDLDYFPVRGYSVDQGRAWTAVDEQTKARVCLIGRTALRNLFGTVDPIGRTVRIDRHPYTIIGTLAPKGQSPFGEDQDDRIVMPVSTWMTRISPDVGKRVNLIMASATTAGHSDAARAQVEAILSQRHRIAAGEEPDFRVGSQEAVRQTQDRVLGILTALLVSVALVSLFVGGVGVTNIMLVSVAERRREIGVRMALGARPGDIEAQFLTEALALAGLGGIAGLLLSFAILTGIEGALGWSLALRLDALLAAFVTSVTVGLVFGFLPARRAARLEPMEALRHE